MAMMSDLDEEFYKRVSEMQSRYDVDWRWARYVYDGPHTSWAQERRRKEMEEAERKIYKSVYGFDIPAIATIWPPAYLRGIIPK